MKLSPNSIRAAGLASLLMTVNIPVYPVGDSLSYIFSDVKTSEYRDITLKLVPDDEIILLL